MPLTVNDRRFLRTVQRLHIYLLIMAVAVFVYLALTPTSEIRPATCIVGLALCAMFWLTQRLLLFIAVLDVELTRILRVIKRSFTEEQLRKEYSIEG